MKTSLDIVLVSFNNSDDVNKTFTELERLGFIGNPNVCIQIVDSSSTQNSELLKRLSEKLGIKYTWANPEGIYPAMNLAIDITSSDWVWFLNPGDLPSMPCEDLLSLIKLYNTSLVPALVFKTHTLSEAGTYIRSRNLKIPPPSFLPTRFDFCHQGILYARSIFDSGIRYRTQYRLISDKIMNDQVITMSTPIFKNLLARFFVGGRSGSKYHIRLELITYMLEYITRHVYHKRY